MNSAWEIELGWREGSGEAVKSKVLADISQGEVRHREKVTAEIRTLGSSGL